MDKDTERLINSVCKEILKKRFNELVEHVKEMRALRQKRLEEKPK